VTSEISLAVRLFGTLRDRLPESAVRGEVQVSVAGGTDAAAVLARIGITVEDYRHLVVLVNGRQVGLDHVLKEGDVLSAFPALAGG
jgi:molybdopterin converting factor small subunit